MATILHLPMTELPVVDLGPSQLTVTNNGCTIDTVNGKFGNGLRFTAAESDYLQIPNHALFDFGSNNWTIHLWAYWHTWTTWAAFCGNLDFPAGTAGHAWTVSTGSRTVRWHDGQVGWRIITSQLIGLTSLNHYALVRDGTNVRIYENGTLMTGGSWAHGDQAQLTPTTNFRIGSFYGNGDSGFPDVTMSEFIIDDTALWTSNFTPPDAPLTYEYAVDRYVTPAGSVEEVAAALETQLETIDDSKAIHHMKVIQDSRSKDLLKGVLITDS